MYHVRTAQHELRHDGGLNRRAGLCDADPRVDGRERCTHGVICARAAVCVERRNDLVPELRKVERCSGVGVRRRVRTQAVRDAIHSALAVV